MRVWPLDPLEVCAWLFALAETVAISPLGGSADTLATPLRVFGAREPLLAAMTVLVVWQGAGIIGLLRGTLRRLGWGAGVFGWLWALLAGVLSGSVNDWVLLVPIVVINVWTYRRAAARGSV
jgi:hypothetical protein